MLKTLEFSVTKSKAYEDTSFVAGDSPVTLDFLTDVGRPANNGYFIVDGAGDILFEIWNAEQEDFGDQHTAKDGDMIILNGLHMRQLRLTHSGTDSAYRILVAG